MKQGTSAVFAPGDAVQQPGVYAVLHGKQHREPHDVLVLRTLGAFPACRDCGDEVRYRLVLAAPHILTDEDFSDVQQ
jgi:hypothetical protein